MGRGALEMTRRFVQIDGVLYERGSEPAPSGHMVIGDIAPYQSMIDGSLITSRSRHREHLRAHGYQEVGNDSSLWRAPVPVTDVNPERRKELIRSQIDRMTHKEFKSALRREAQHTLWNSRKD